MPLNPEARAYLDRVAALNLPTLPELGAVLARKFLPNAEDLCAEPPALARVENRSIPGRGGAIELRIYTPPGSPPHPILVYFHGGGWVLGDLDRVDRLCHTLSTRAASIVVSVDYRLAPEHPFPAAVEDADDAARWVAENATYIYGDPRRIRVGGDSAGGNLAAAVALTARDRGFPTLEAQLLFYPVTRYGFETESYRQNAGGYGLSREDMIWFWRQYLKTPEDGENPRASPLLARSHENLPPALIVTAEYDPLRDEGEAYGESLRRSGVPVAVVRYEGTIHGFVTMAKILPEGRDAIARAVDFLK